MNQNPVEGYMDNTIAAVFTMMLPGLGQMLMNRIIPGLIWSVAVGGGYLLNGWLGLMIHVLCILDTALIGGLKNLLGQYSPLKKVGVVAGLTTLIIYTCLRTALF